jgi:hypothetical protein
MDVHLGYKGDNLAKLEIKPIQDSFAEANLEKGSNKRSLPHTVEEIKQYFGSLVEGSKMIDQKKWELDGIHPNKFSRVRNDQIYL